MSDAPQRPGFFTPAADLSGTWRQERVPGLPAVLVIGDSISIGCMPHLRALLAGRATVHRPLTAEDRPVNCGDTRAGLAQLDTWLVGGPWNLIRFNWGLHDLAYRHPESTVYGNRDKIRGAISVPLEAYGRNLEQLVERLRATGARLLWASSTVVPEGEAGRFAGDEIRYNAVAAEIMARHGIPIDDQHAVSAGFGPAFFKAPGDVHFTADGSALLAQAAATAIVEALA